MIPAKTNRPARARRLARAALRYLLTWAVFLLLAEGTVRIVQSTVAVGAAESPKHFHLYVVGGSSARGVPYDFFPLGRVVADSLGGRVGDLPIELHVLAEGGASIYAQAIRFERLVLSRDADVPGAVLIYSGHNDRIVPGEDDGPILDAIERGLFSRTALGREAFHGLRRLAGSPPKSTLASYEFYLRGMVEGARRSGLVPVLSSVVSNVRDIDPNVDVGEDLEAVFAALSDVSDFGGPDCPDRLAVVRKRLAPYPRSEPLLVYAQARCLDAQGRHGEARERYWQAIGLDVRSHFGRATLAQNAIVHRLAGEYAVPYVDAVGLFEAASPEGIMGTELFNDGHHPNLDGYVILATGFAEALSSALSIPLQRRFSKGQDYLAYARIPGVRDLDVALNGGSWLLKAASGHPWPARRLALAEGSYRRAVAADPASFSAWAGLGLAEAGRSSILNDEAVNDRLARWGVYSCGPFSIPRAELVDFLALLERGHVGGALRRRIADAYEGGTPPSAPDRVAEGAAGAGRLLSASSRALRSALARRVMGASRPSWHRPTAHDPS